MKPSAVSRQPPAVVLWMLFLALIMPMSAMAQLTTDPTRPPSGYGDGEAAAGQPESAGGMTLQSVMISPTHKAAIISGVIVKLGEKYGDAVLIKVAENEVVLRSGDANQVLKLYPGVEKRDSTPAPAKHSRQGKMRSADPAPPR
jgi:MSHA biogenesis protein MshK